MDERGKPSTVRGGSKLSDRVSALLQERILSGDFAPGEKLPTEAELEQSLDVSRSVIRDALRALSVRGLVDIRQGRGVTVTEPDDYAYGDAMALLLRRSDLTMGDVLDARRSLETAFAALMIDRSNKEDHQRLRASYDRFRDAVNQQSWQRAAVEHMAVHVGLFRAIHMPALEMLLAPMQEVIILSSTPPVSGADLWDVPLHEPIVRALEEQDETALRRSLDDHYGSLHGPAYDAWKRRRFHDAVVSPGDGL